MNKWFDETFLPSVFAQAGINGTKWLSQKQTTICCENMVKKSVRCDDRYGDTFSHDLYSCEWQGRKVILQYSKKNCCGSISFGFIAAESARAAKESETEKTIEKAHKIKRIKSKPERLAKMIANLKKEIANREESLQDAITDGEKEEYIKIDVEKIAELKAELALYI